MFVQFFPKSVVSQENPLTRAILLFDKEKYAEAEVIFKKILDERPDDFMVNYFYGACRTENGHYSEQDVGYLIKASKEVTPLNIDYYFAVQYHALNQWERAQGYYKIYKAVASANEQEKLQLSQKIELCNNRINPFKTAETIESNARVEVIETQKAEAEKEIFIGQPVKTETPSSGAVKIDELPDLDIAAQPVNVNGTSKPSTVAEEAVSAETGKSGPKVVPQKPADGPIVFNVNSEITYISVSNFKTTEGKIYFEQGNRKQKELNEIVENTEKLREKYSTSQYRSEKDSIGRQILELESDAYDLRYVVKELFLQAKTAENGYWQNASPNETSDFKRELLVLAEEARKKTSLEINKPVPVSEIVIPPALIENQVVESPQAKPSTSGVVYKIQLGAYSRGIPNNLKPVYNKISIIRKVENYTDENGVVVYTTGNLTNYEDAVLMQNQVKQEGINVPIIAAYLNGKRITLKQAKEIEKNK